MIVGGGVQSRQLEVVVMVMIVAVDVIFADNEENL
jgi:hypothetical protein